MSLLMFFKRKDAFSFDFTDYRFWKFKAVNALLDQNSLLL